MMPWVVISQKQKKKQKRITLSLREIFSCNGNFICQFLSPTLGIISIDLLTEWIRIQLLRTFPGCPKKLVFFCTSLDWIISVPFTCCSRLGSNSWVLNPSSQITRDTEIARSRSGQEGGGGYLNTIWISSRSIVKKERIWVILSCGVTRWMLVWMDGGKDASGGVFVGWDYIRNFSEVNVAHWGRTDKLLNKIPFIF